MSHDGRYMQSEPAEQKDRIMHSVDLGAPGALTHARGRDPLLGPRRLPRRRPDRGKVRDVFARLYFPGNAIDASMEGRKLGVLRGIDRRALLDCRFL